MRNLKLVDKVKCKLENIKDIKRAFIDPNASHLQLYLQTESDLHLYNCKDNTTDEVLKTPAKIIDWDYLALNNEICLASHDGDVTVVNLSTNNVESVTFCEGGIRRMCWSPDQEVVVFVTSGQNVVVMNCTYDPIAESSLLDDSFGDQEFITVGWGKKETQFHGSEGKAAAKKKSDFIAPEDVSSLNASTNITWRGDGEYFAVSFLSNAGRTFKVYNKEGQLQFTAERMNNLGEAIAWRPSGNWIAVPHRLPNKYTIGLFEKNGLRHREIVLPFKYEDEPVVSLCWSGDSDILAIETIREGKSNVYLYTIGNYHWYLKQTLNFQEKVNMCQWDTGFNETKKLHIVLESGVYLKYRWTFEVCISIGNRMSNLCIAAVIDGNKALLTDFRNNIIPPPMSKYALQTSANINAIGFINDPENPRKLFTVTADGKLSTYSTETHQDDVRSVDRLTGVTLLKETALLDHTMSQLPLYYNHWMWLNEEHIVFCDSQSSVFLQNLSTGSRTCKQIAGQIVATCPVTQSSFVVHLSTGDLLFFNVENEQLSEPEPFATLPEYCEHLQAISIDNSVKSIALKDNQNLYLDDTKLSGNVTSFFIGEHYFAYTQLTSLKFIDLTKLPDLSVVSERRIERGGKLIAIVPKDSVTVLQMPRGNLEAMQPRVLSLQIIGELLDASRYEKAMLMLRKQRINLNIIFDHNPKKFMENVETFLMEIANAQWLNLFLAELENEDYTQTKYASNYECGHAEYPENFAIERKITFVCDFLYNVMKSKNDDRFIQPIITCSVKKGELENALDLIWSLKEAESKNGAREKTDDALRYLLYMADVSELYNVALGMYNFQLVLLVADKSQKDPREYIPFLKDLNKLEENYKKFKIDDYLKRHERAFQNIANCGKEKFNECLAYVEKHNLYTVALQRFEKGDEEFYRSIARSFADYLRTAGKIENASIMYERGRDYKQAIASAKHVLDADRCLMIAKLAGYDADETKNLAVSLVPGLQSNARHEDAFHLLAEYGDNFEDALNTLLEGRFYLKAIFEARRKSEDLIQKLVKPHLESYGAILRSTLETDKEQFLKHTNRLKIVRLEKAKGALDDDYVDEGDLISETTSVASRYTGTSRSSGTGKTFRSSKNRRKHERKLLNLKEGGKFEDIALIDALYKQVQHIYEQQQPIHKICKAFVEVRIDGEGRAVQALYRDLLSTVKNKLDEIWTPELMNASQTMFGANLDYAQVQNDQHNAMIPLQQRFQPVLNIIDWELAILK